MSYIILPVDGATFAKEIIAFNQMVPAWPDLTQAHLTEGFWWFASLDGNPIGFAGLTKMHPFDGVGYFKRAYVMPPHRGRGLQMRFMAAREEKARHLGWHMLVSECAANNARSIVNFERFGFERCSPEQTWGEPGSVYFMKRI